MKLLPTFLALAIVLTPAFVFPMEREGTTLFLSFEEVRELLRNPSPQQLIPPLSLQFQEDELQDRRIEREYRWGHGLGINGYDPPDTQRRPLWGY